MVSKARQFIRPLNSGPWFCAAMEASFILQPATQGCRYTFLLPLKGVSTYSYCHSGVGAYSCWRCTQCLALDQSVEILSL